MAASGPTSWSSCLGSPSITGLWAAPGASTQPRVSPHGGSPLGLHPLVRARPGRPRASLREGQLPHEPWPECLCPLSTGPCSLSSCRCPPGLHGVLEGFSEPSPQLPHRLPRAPAPCPCHHAAPALDRPLKSSLGPMAKRSLPRRRSQRQEEGHGCWQCH